MSKPLRPLNDALKVIAKETINEVESNIENEIKILKEWIRSQPHLKARTDDQYLLAFLRSCKHSLEKTKSRIEYFYTIKGLIPEITKNSTMDEKFQEFARMGTYLWPPTPPNSGDALLCILRFEHFNKNLFSLNDIHRYRFMGLEYILNEIDNSSVVGQIEVIDLANVPFVLYKQLDLIVAKKLRIFSEKGMPFRYKSIHVIHCKKEYANLLNIVKGLLVEKYRNRLYVHDTIEELHNYVPKSLLPMEYGGTNSTIKEITAQNERQMMGYSDYFIENTKFGVDESLRPRDTIVDTKSLFGLEGSFKKLEID